MKGPLFANNEGEQFYYSPITGKILSMPRNISTEQLIPEKGSFSFDYSLEKVKNTLKSKLDTLILEGSQNCNLRCDYCIYGGNYAGERIHQPFNMPLDIAIKATDYFIEHSWNKKPFRFISFYGGEPLLNFEIIKKIVERHRDKERLKFSISTNGILLDKYTDFIQENSIMIALSLDGPKEVHDKYRLNITGDGSFEKIMKNIGRFRPGFVRKNFTFSATIKDKEDLIKVYEFFSNNFPRNTMRVGFTKENHLKEKWESTFNQKNHFGFLSKSYFEKINNGEPDRFLKFLFDESMKRIFYRAGQDLGEEIEPVGFCIPGTRKLFVNYNGKFYMCEKLGYKEFEIGDVNNGINLEKVISLLEEIKDFSSKNCSNCWAARLCDSCVMLNSCINGEIDWSRLDKKCEKKKIDILNYLKVYIENYQDSRFMGYLKEMKGGE